MQWGKSSKFGDETSYEQACTVYNFEYFFVFLNHFEKMHDYVVFFPSNNQEFLVNDNFRICYKIITK